MLNLGSKLILKKKEEWEKKKWPALRNYIEIFLPTNLKAGVGI